MSKRYSGGMHQPSPLQRTFNNPLFTTVYFGAIWGLLFTATEHVKIDGYVLMVHILTSLIFGAFMTLALHRQLRRFDKAIGITSLEQRVTLQYALKNVELPTDPATRQLLPTYLDYIEERQRKQQRSNRVVLPIIFIFYIGNAVWLRSWWWLLVGGLFLLILIRGWQAQRRNWANVPKLRAAL